MMKLYPNCWSVAYRNSAYFIYHKFKVEGDRDFILKAFNANDTNTLDFMESFYENLRKDQTCNKDIMSRSYCKPIPSETIFTKKKKIHLES